MKKLTLRIISSCLCMAMILPLASCNKKKKEPRKRVVQEADPYYSCEEMRLDLPIEGISPRELKGRGIRMAKVFRDCVLVNVSESYVIPEDFQKEWDEYRENWLKYSEEERQKLEEEYRSYRREGLAVFNLDGTMKGFTDIPSNSEICLMLEDPAGTPKVLISTEGSSEYTSVIYEISPTGELVNGITLEFDRGLSDMIFMENGNVLCCDNSSVFLFDAEGKLLNEESILLPVKRLFRIEGKYYAYTEVKGDVYDETALPTLSMFEIDPVSGKKIGEKRDVTSKVHFTKLEQGKDSVYSVQGDGIKEYDLLTGKEPQIKLSWYDTDCNYFHTGIGIWNPNMYMTSENDLYFVHEMDERFSPDNWPSPSFVVLQHFHREEKNPHVGKNIIYLAYLYSVKNDMTQDFIDYLNLYNLDPQKKARIVMMDYSTDSSLYTSAYSTLISSTDEQSILADQVYLDLLAGDGPDILVNFGSFSQFNTERALVDLNTLIDGNSPLDRSALFDNILRSYEIDGKLYQIPQTFEVTGMVANRKYVEGRTGWTYEEFREISQSLPKDVSIIGKVSRNDLLKILMDGSTSHFLDYNGQKVNFDDPEFREILDFVKEFGVSKTSGEIMKEMNQDETVVHDETKFQEGMIVAKNESFDRLEKFGNIGTWCDGNAQFIGSPSRDGSSGMAYNAKTFAIARLCPFVDEAWSFLKGLFDEDIQLSNAKLKSKFPVNRKAFDALMKMDVEENQQDWEKAKTDKDLAIWLMYDSAHLGEEQVTELKKVIENIHDSCSSDPSALMIIQEEAPGYFNGDRTLDDVVNNIQKRCKAVVQERG
ncbi:MAG: carbohydrate ABC transporter substrate-binding protein [Clostridiales bacterium]|nr:carbohydrate ABC transporter substrate-binding protein [Clostridiales bacterium]